MLTETENEIEPEMGLPPELAAITETVEYPPEIVERWVRESEITWQQFKNGEIKSYETVEEFAAEYGIFLDD